MSSTPATNTPSKPPAEPIPGADESSNPSSDIHSPSPPGRENIEGVDSSPVSSSEKRETPLSMAMRQAGAEAAKKAGEKKGSMSRAPASAKDLEVAGVPMAALETKMAKTVEEPSASAGITGAKIPEKLAEEGAKRTSVDKIAGEGAKRTNVDNFSEPDGASEQGHVGLSREATILEARSANSTTKLKSPLSEEETAATSRTELGAADLEPQSSTHRGSSISSASKEEIESVERKDAIPEEPEGTDEFATEAEGEGTDASPKQMKEAARNLEGSAGAKTREVAASNEGEMAATKGIKPQKEDAKEARGAGTSVGD